MESDTSQVYYPRLVGLAPPGIIPQSGKWFELLVTGRDETGGLSKLSSLLAQHDVSLTPSGGYFLISPNTFVWTTFADFTFLKSSPESVLRDIRRLNFVSRADAVEVKGAALDRFLFPVVINGDRRGIIMSLSSLLKVEQRLTEMLGSGGAVLMFEEGRTYARDELEWLSKVVPQPTTVEFLNTVTAWYRTTGWGLIDLDASKLADEGIVSVEVGEAPNSVVDGNQGHHFLDGVMVGIVESVFKRKVRVTSSIYDKPSRTLQLLLRGAR